MTGIHAQQGEDSRATARSNMFLAATLRGDGQTMPVKVRNMSPSGALVEAASAPEAGSQVVLDRGSLSVRAIVAWSAPGRCGLRFSWQVVVRDWLAPPGNAAQQRVDDAVRVLKLGAVPLPARAPEPTAGYGIDLNELGRDLEAAARLIDDLGNALAADRQVVSRHFDKLQYIDLAVQLMSVVGGTLSGGGGDGDHAAERLRNLRASLAQAQAR